MSEGKPLRLGLKLWSSNQSSVPEVCRLFENGVIQYLELYVVPGTFRDQGDLWRIDGLPMVLHAPHFGAGFNLSLKDKETANKAMWHEVMQFAQRLNPLGLIVHMGTCGTLMESMRQLSSFDLPPCPMWVENKPPFTQDGSECVGVSPQEIRDVKLHRNSGFCFDLGHALCYAAHMRLEPHGVLQAFSSMNPDMYHLCDGFVGDVRDRHLHLGEGNYDLPALIRLLPEHAMLSLETPKRSMEDLSCFEAECRMVRDMSRACP
ncbi:MAG: hypothetical protein HQL84_00510 [Magnetococcales bacterium]|nr:hypothetical protein [Magnetococcales bacterium]MBF0148510.1 hypothetical protein [Magnetococcales bacterium]MBF0174608.1 hypothetical protein [Magnetococcales bacterium]MBF0630643.1 hypothetical protein [Magnetococcales bacterium]